jgi:glycosyltransferase involved in cell wall biosynthesis
MRAAHEHDRNVEVRRSIVLCQSSHYDTPHGMEAASKPVVDGEQTHERPDSRGRICMVLHAGFPTEARVAAEFQAAVASGFEVDVVAMLRPGQAKNEIIGGSRVVRLPIRHVYGRRGLGMLVEYLGFSLVATIQVARLAARHRYKIIHIHNPPDFLAIAALIPRLRGAKVIFDVHDLAPDMFQWRFEGRPGVKIFERILRRIERSVARMSDHVLTVHEPYKEELARRGVPSEKISVVLNTVPEDLLPNGDVTRSGDGFRVVYHGTITPHYGVETLVEALARASEDIPALTLDIYGEGDSLERVRTRTRELGLEDRVEFHPFMNQRDVLAAVAGASVGVVPNLPIPINRFALSTKLLEYVALGIPVVSSDLPTMRVHFTDDEIRYFEAGNPAALAEALVQAYRDPVAARQRATAARARFAEYRWPIQAQRYRGVLEALANQDD